MLIEFSVANYRSFREKQTFSMVAVPRLKKKKNVFSADVQGEKFPDLLKVAAIYGPNASGKSNLIKALSFVNQVIRNNRLSSRGSSPFLVSPFRFDRSLANKPSRFEYHFIADKQRYEFVLAAVADRIVEERLIAFPKGKETLLYSRSYTSKGEKYKFGEELEGSPALHDLWRSSTNPKSLFIVQAVENSAEEFQQLRRPFSWLSMSLTAITRDMTAMARMTAALGIKWKDNKMERDVAAFLNKLDVPVSKVKFEMAEDSKINNGLNFTDEDLQDVSEDEDFRSIMKSLGKIKATFTHKTALGNADFDLDEESDGTKSLIGLHIPWLAMLTGQDRYDSLVVDELDSSLHPQIVAKLIEQLIELDKPSQLIFTTHDTHLMDTKLLRRDQIWITERDMNGATQLRSIHDFEGRESEDVEKRYYEGRYRGLPILNRGK